MLVEPRRLVVLERPVQSLGCAKSGAFVRGSFAIQPASTSADAPDAGHR
jgi:hypothetical protein